MKQKLLLLTFALFTTIGGAWADQYTITYKADGSFNSSSGWCSTWISSTTPTVTIQSSGNGFNTGNGNLAQQTFTISVVGSYFISGYKISSTGWGSTVTPTRNHLMNVSIVNRNVEVNGDGSNVGLVKEDNLITDKSLWDEEW